MKNNILAFIFEDIGYFFPRVQCRQCSHVYLLVLTGTTWNLLQFFACTQPNINSPKKEEQQGCAAQWPLTSAGSVGSWVECDSHGYASTGSAQLVVKTLLKDLFLLRDIQTFEESWWLYLSMKHCVNSKILKCIFLIDLN